MGYTEVSESMKESNPKSVRKFFTEMKDWDALRRHDTESVKDSFESS